MQSKRMKEVKKVLYITYIDMHTAPSSGSSVRPIRMYEAFKDLNYDVKLLSGAGNNHKIRKNNTAEIKIWLKTNRPDICYIEPPSGPLFYHCDRALIKKIKSLNIPIGFFYRDAYWKFPGFKSNNSHESISQRIKNIVIRLMQKRDLKLIKKTCSIVYFPTELMASYFDFENMQALPPGCYINSHTHASKGEIPSAIFIGGATIRYGIKLLLDSGIKINQDNIKLNIKIVCQENAWKSFLNNNPEYSEQKYSWLQIYHINTGIELNNLYSLSNFAIVPLLKNKYHDFAMTIKLSEYLSNLLPVVVTDCEETAKFVNNNNIGIVAHDNSNDFADAMMKMIDMLDNQADDLNKHCIIARNNNLWIARAAKVCTDLSNFIDNRRK